ncbi:MAG: hypothetical protein NE327_06300 [Lentisphaeraceae bacterium]|nr:hypothetical protein [Lentisphaeraceae bacterium]
MDTEGEETENGVKVIPKNLRDKHGKPLKDMQGRTFDKVLHIWSEVDGEIVPKLTKTGKLRCNQKSKIAEKKLEAEEKTEKLEAEEIAKLEVFEEQAKEERTAEEKAERGKKHGKALAGAIVQSVQKSIKAGFGEEAGKLEDNEKEILEDSAKETIEESGGIGLTGGKLFAFLSLLFFLPPIISMAVNGELKGAFGKMLAKFKDRKSKTFDAESGAVVDADFTQ